MREAVAARAAEPVPGEAPRADAPPPAEGEPAPEKFKVGQYELSEPELAAMITRQAAEDIRKANLPSAPEGYEARLPADLKLPGGMEYRFDASDPSLVAAQNLAHAKGWSQQDFSEALGFLPVIRRSSMPRLPSARGRKLPRPA
jgi:hypothetical protein